MPSGLTLLIVDDDPIGAKFTELDLQKYGFRTIVALSVAEALQIIGEQTIDFCITDFNMPEATGLDLLRAIREQEEHKHLPVIVHSGLVTAEMRRELSVYEPLGVYQKPVEPEDFITAMSNSEKD